MKKAIILVGEPRTGKSRCAQIIAECAGNWIEIDGTSTKEILENHFIFQQCEKDTQTIIIDNCHPKLNYESFFNLLDSLKVEKKGQEAFTINPRFIFSTNHEPQNTESASFKARFEVIHL